MSKSSYVPVMGHELHVMEWGDPKNAPLVMWHGLARTGRDFDELAEALSDEWFVLCPDTIGRGLSTWSNAPLQEYNPNFYAILALGMLDAYAIRQTAWLGTSLGALVGMKIASGAAAARLSCLIINDIAPEIPQEAIDRILKYASELPVFATVLEAEAWLREVYAPFGPAGDAFWRRMAETSVSRLGDGRLTLHYDPNMVDMLKGPAATLGSWSQYERIATPTHIIRGASSDILPAQLAQRMMNSGPRPGETVFEDAGHAPSLSRPQDAKLVRDILKRLSDNYLSIFGK